MIYEFPQETFEDLKNRLIEEATSHFPCPGGMEDADNAFEFLEGTQVIKEHFVWLAQTGVLTPEIIQEFEEDFKVFDIYWNPERVKRGYALVTGEHQTYAEGEALVVALDHSSILASGNATVYAKNNSSVTAEDTVRINAYDHARVDATDYVTVISRGNNFIKARGRSTCYFYENGEAHLNDRSYGLLAAGSPKITVDDLAVLCHYSNLLLSDEAKIISKGNSTVLRQQHLAF